jgi:hypothetical protein
MIMRAAIYKFNKMEGSVEDFLYLYNQTFVADTFDQHLCCK